MKVVPAADLFCPRFCHDKAAEKRLAAEKAQTRQADATKKTGSFLSGWIRSESSNLHDTLNLIEPFF